MDLFDFAAEHGLFDPPPLHLEIVVGGGEIKGGAVDDELHPGRVTRLFDGGKARGQPVSVSRGSDRTCRQTGRLPGSRPDPSGRLSPRALVDRPADVMAESPIS